ncbi:DNA topoisomerase 3 [Faecalibacterium duncaniae]|uniref:DNA topoisomerase 3 n=1 Tax=Faecalibacterium duncaniae (strain DSM 17677 / JCM 31915 / A2-165) TaxID=411483 RepID=UPI003EDB21FE
MKLVLAEKPSVAMSLSKVIGADQRGDGYMEGNGYLVSWCVGHLVELSQPEAYDEKYAKWKYDDLPILPEHWQYQVSASTKKQFGILKKLMQRKDVESLICATDAGREGELIFRLVYHQCGCKKPVERLWISSMEDSAIREGFQKLRPGTEYDALYEAALCRERADWMVGINASRLFSCLYNQPLAVGRVMTPVLAMTVLQEAAIAAFVPEKFYTVSLTLADGGTASSKRFAQKADAELLLSKCRKEKRVTVQKMERKEKSESPPQLYDLTALQRDANRLLGFTAQQTLDYAQSLYEKRLITYPRTDSRFLTEDMAASLPGLVTDTGKAFAVEEPLPIHVQQVINGSKVTDHHALLPTKSMANADLAALPAGERNVLRLIAARLLCAVGEPHRYAETTLTTICAGEEFSAKGKVVLSEGWKTVERKMLGDLLGKQKEAVVLPDVKEQSQCSVAGAELKEGQTSPPKPYTEDTLLSAMQAAGADSMPEGVERQGIGTPATRAATIEKLVQKGFLERKGSKKTKVLLPTDKGKALITVMPEEIQSPEMTADWETKLLQIERGEMEPGEFMTEINTMITELVKNTEMKKGVNALMKNKIIGVCPNCGANVVEREKGWFCESNPCRFVLWKDNAFFKRLGKRLDGRMADKLLRDGRVRLKDCKSAKGKTYNATVLLSTEPDGRSKFSLEFEGGC